jgi:protease PrsW
MEYIALAAAPGIAICMYIFYKDVYNREPGLNLIVSFLLGCVAILPAVLFEDAFGFVNNGTITGVAAFAYCVVGFSEEMSKFLGLRLYSYNQRAFDEPLDGIVYAVMVSMGFATVENILYAIKYHDLNIVVLRMFLSVPAHATFGIIMGYFAGKAKFSPGNSFGFLFIGLLSAIFFHGTFDFFIFASQKEMVGEQAGNGMLAAGALVSFIISLVLCRKLIRRQRVISAEMFKDKNQTTSV